MKALLLFAICYECVSCASAPPVKGAPVYDKTIHLVVTMDTPSPTWAQSAAATFSPIVGPVNAIYKLLTTP